MEDHQKPSPKSDRSFSFLSEDEIEKLRQENEKKIATITRETKKKIASASDNINNNDQFDVNEDDEEFYRNKNLIISQHVMDSQYEDEDANGRPQSPTAKSQAPHSRIPVRTANAEKRARDLGLLQDIDETKLSPSELRALRAEKRAAWRQARLKSLEQDAIQAQIMIQSLNTDTTEGGMKLKKKPRDMLDGVEEEESNDDVLIMNKSSTKSRLKFPRIAIKLRPGQVTVREKETVLDEKIVQRTEEVCDPYTGEPTIQTFEYVEKTIEREVETCQEKIFSLELEDPKSLESPSTPTTIADITTALEQFISSPRTCDDSDDNQSIETVVSCSSSTIIDENILFLNSSASDPSDYANANVSSRTILETIVEVVNPILIGDGTANEIAVSRMRNDDLSLTSFDIDDDGDEEQEQLSLNDKMKNVLKELRENEKVRLSWSRSMEEEDDVEMPETSGSPSYEAKTGSIGTVFMVRERLINDFYDHEQVANQENIDSCQVYSNPSVDEFLAHEIRHAQATPETLTLDLRKNDDNEDEDDEDTTADSTPTSPTKSLASDLANLATAGGNKKRRRNKKSKAKK